MFKPGILLLAFTLNTLLSYTSAQDPEVYTLSGFIDDETVSTTATASDSLLYSNEQLLSMLEPADTLSFEERLEMEQQRLLMPLEIDTSIDVSSQLMPRIYYMPIVYKPYKIKETTDCTLIDESKTAITPTLLSNSTQWLYDEIARHDKMEAAQQEFCARYPWIVKLNLESLPEPPKKYVATVDPKSAKIKIEELKVDLNEANKEITAIDVKPKHWIHDFTGTVQFSQAYNSPNWYQGGNNNLNLIGNFVWNVKLNSTYHPKLLFENTVQYKVAVNSAPDDTIRSYSISEDLFQVNTKFGLKASHNWYYTATMQFKTQLLQHYPTNSHSLKAAFMSPGELNIGLGMTYNKVSADKKLTFDLSISPLSYNMICYRNIHVSAYNGHKVNNQYGSNLEGKLTWKPVYNISYVSRLYTFTNYEYLQGDWEHTVSFDINQFLSTQIYVHLRYDSSTKKLPDSGWHQWQLKEILSFGFAYKFNSLK